MPLEQRASYGQSEEDADKQHRMPDGSNEIAASPVGSGIRAFCHNAFQEGRAGRKLIPGVYCVMLETMPDFSCVSKRSTRIVVDFGRMVGKP